MLSSLVLPAAAPAAASLAAPAVAQQGNGLSQLTEDAGRLDQSLWPTSVAIAKQVDALGDPISPAAARRLETVIEDRFSLPITQMIISRHHADHASGGEVFADTAEVVGSVNLEASAETAGVTTPSIDISAPLDGISLDIGVKTLVFTHLPLGRHSDELIITAIRTDDADIVSPMRLPWRAIRGQRLNAVFKQIETVTSLDLEIILPGRGLNCTQADANEQCEYLVSMRDRVEARLDGGKDVETIDAELTMSEHADGTGYASSRPAKVRSMIDHLTC